MIISNKQTAVEWLVSQLNKQGFAKVVTDEEIEQAKAMEKEQIENAFENGVEDIIYSRANYEDGEQYYNETFGDTK
jgi:predicted fused transcriptional regulator/phosphomethylpyrimidine kinase